MKQDRINLKLLTLIFAFTFAVFQYNLAGDAGETSQDFGKANSSKLPQKCSVFTFSEGSQVFFGGNNDYIDPDTYFWVDPGNGKRWGAIWVGNPGDVQQGVNEKGLAYDANGLPRFDVNPHKERVPVTGGYTSYPILILHECSTVEEVINWVNTHQWHSFMQDQMQFADATGDAVIISAGESGEIVFTRKPKGDGFLVSTNFNVANSANNYSYPCWRYDKAQEILVQFFNREEAITAQDAIGVLDAVHMGGGSSWTISSMLADLTNGEVYLFYYFQFDKPVIINVKEELANPRSPGMYSKLFPDDVQQEASRRYKYITGRVKLSRNIGISWIISVLVSLALVFIIHYKGIRKMKFWIPAIIILGIVGLLAWLVLRNQRKESLTQTALLETLANLLPIVVSLVIVLVILILMASKQSLSWFEQLGLIWLFPVLAVWLFFYLPFLFSLSNMPFWQFLVKQLPNVFVVTNRGIAGTLAVAIPLVNKSIQSLPVFPISPKIVIIWWGIIVFSSIAGGVLIYFYERWAVRNDYKAWSVMILEVGAVSSPTWKKLWWRIIISYMLILVGTAIGVIINKALL